MPYLDNDLSQFPLKKLVLPINFDLESFHERTDQKHSNVGALYEKVVNNLFLTDFRNFSEGRRHELNVHRTLRRHPGRLLKSLMYV